MEEHAAKMTRVPPDIARMSPIEIMLRAASLAAAAGQWDKAAQLASLVAPYLHPKLSSVDLKAAVACNASELSDEQLLALAQGSTAAAALTYEPDTEQAVH